MEVLIFVAMVFGILIGYGIHDVLTERGGTKGISENPYKSKTGKTHTAKKNREDHIV
tara:strand:+ start:4938 stop:5108 length:171 start_codon:yes stop_codon:yes gene_type:complete